MNSVIFLGIDAGNDQHAVAALDENNQFIYEDRIRNTHPGCNSLTEKIQSWIQQGYEVWVGGEGKGGYMSPLDKHLCNLDCKYVNILPKQYQRFREMMDWQPDKTDEKDARGLAQFLRWRVEHDKASPTPLLDEYFETLRGLARTYNQMSKSKVVLQNQMVSAVREYWPELFLDKFFSRSDSKALLALLKKYPTPALLLKARKSSVKQLLSKASRCDQSELTERLRESARSIPNYITVSESKASLIQTWAESLAHVIHILEDLERQLEQQLKNHPFGKWLLDQEGIGVRTAGSFLGEAGNLDRFETEAQLARFAGNGAIINQSGKTTNYHKDMHRYNHRLKRAIILMAKSRARFHPESKAYIDARKDQNEHWKIIKKLARYLIRYLWKAWKEIVHPVNPVTEMK